MIITNQRSLAAALSAVRNTAALSRLEAYASQLNDPSLKDLTTIIVLLPSTSEYEIASELGFSPFINPADGATFPSTQMQPWWDYLAYHEGCYDLIVCFGNTGAATILLVPDEPGYACNLRAMCQHFGGEQS